MSRATATDLPCRDAAPEDRDAVVALWRSCGLTRPWNDPFADFDLALGGAGSTVLLLHDGPDLAGTAMVGHDGHRGGLYYLAVDPARRRQGLGRQLVAAAEAWLASRGIPKLNLLVRRDNEGVIGFYEALGYIDQDCICMGRRLTD